MHYRIKETNLEHRLDSLKFKIQSAELGFLQIVQVMLSVRCDIGGFQSWKISKVLLLFEVVLSHNIRIKSRQGQKKR